MGCSCFLVRVVPQERELLRKVEKSRCAELMQEREKCCSWEEHQPGSWWVFGDGSGTKADGRALLLPRSCCGLAFHKL